jgi:hypothetical protein
MQSTYLIIINLGPLDGTHVHCGEQPCFSLNASSIAQGAVRVFVIEDKEQEKE